MTSLTVRQKTNHDGFPKPVELIEITGAHLLDAPDRAIQNKLFEHAHDSGRIADPVAEWTLSLAEIRHGLSKHDSNDAVRASLSKLMKVGVVVHYTSPQGKLQTLITHLFDFVDVTDSDKGNPTVGYALPKKLLEVLTGSSRWGRVKSEVTYAMTSKYAIALYELICVRAKMDRCIETFDMAYYRDLLGVPPDSYTNGKDFRIKVIEPAVLEVNGLSDLGVQVEMNRRHPKAAATGVTVAWWRKEGDEYQAAMRELDKPKIGRMTRLRKAPH